MVANNAQEECKLNFNLFYKFLEHFGGRSKRGALLWQMC